MGDYVIRDKTTGLFWGSIPFKTIGYYERKYAIVFRWPGEPDPGLPGFRADREEWVKVDEKGNG